jgi:hypothetical protein
MKTKEVFLNVFITLGVLFLKDYILNKINKKERPKIIVYNNSKWKSKSL